MKIGIFGGTFNPPHIGHISAAREAADTIGLDLLIIMPSGKPPHKSLPVGSPAPDARLEMTRLAFDDVSNILISDYEIKKAGPAYTIDTLSAVMSDYPGVQLYLLMGTDMYLTLETWKDGKSILSSATPVVFARTPENNNKIMEYSRYLLEKHKSKTIIIDNNIVEISSSELRDLLPARGGIEYLAEKNYSYIIRERFYDAKADWGWMRARAYSMLDPSRIPHVAGCEEAAVSLAQRWGIDVDDAREAAILHDITKKLTPEENYQILSEHGYDPLDVEFAEGKLLHAKTGAIIALDIFGASEKVAEAIKWHTTGKENMSALEKAIYLADYIEKTRTMDGIEELRALAFKNLDDAMILGLKMSVADITGRGMTVNAATQDALDYLLALHKMT